jgi:hypothetical protein
MLRILAAGSIFAVINQSYTIVWLSLGEFRTNTYLMMFQLPILFGAMFAGYKIRGLSGFVVGVASVEMLICPVQAFLVSRHKLWAPRLDLPLIAGSAALIALGFWLV